MADSESFNSILQKKLHTLSCFFSSKKFQAVFVCVVSVSTCKHFNVHTIIMKAYSIFLMVNMSGITNNQYRPLLCHPWRKSTDSLVNQSLLRAAGLEILIQHCKKLSLTNSKYLDHLRNQTTHKVLLGLRNIVSICPIGSLRTDQNNMSEQLLKVEVSD